MKQVLRIFSRLSRLNYVVILLCHYVSHDSVCRLDYVIVHYCHPFVISLFGPFVQVSVLYSCMIFITGREPF